MAAFTITPPNNNKVILTEEDGYVDSINRIRALSLDLLLSLLKSIRTLKIKSVHTM